LRGDENNVSFKHSSRRRTLKNSMKAFCVGLPNGVKLPLETTGGQDLFARLLSFDRTRRYQQMPVYVRLFSGMAWPVSAIIGVAAFMPFMVLMRLAASIPSITGISTSIRIASKSL
jgi:hypothetical protein